MDQWDQGVRVVEAPTWQVHGTAPRKLSLFRSPPYSSKTSGQTSLKYLHADHLGSTDTITDATGAVIERLSYDPHGKRRNVNWTPAPGLLAAIHTDRGFTGHEHLDEVGLIHMTKSPGAILNRRRRAPQGRGQGQPE